MLFLDILFGLFVGYEYMTLRNALIEASAAQTENAVALNRVANSIHKNSSSAAYL